MSLFASTRSLVLAFSTLAAIAPMAIGCGASPDSTPSPTVKPAPGDGTKPTTTNGPVAADPTADPVPAELPSLVARTTEADVAPDLSCAGKPLPLGVAPLTEREFHMI